MAKGNLALAALLLIPIAIVAGGATKATGKRRPGDGNGGPTPFDPPPPPTNTLPWSDQMEMTPDCNGMAVRVDAGLYDVRITNKYFELRNQWGGGGSVPDASDFTDIASEILRMDNPQCQWPGAGEEEQFLGDKNISLLQKALFDFVRTGVERYYLVMEMNQPGAATIAGGEVYDVLKPVFGM